VTLAECHFWYSRKYKYIIYLSTCQLHAATIFDQHIMTGLHSLLNFARLFLLRLFPWRSSNRIAVDSAVSILLNIYIHIRHLSISVLSRHLIESTLFDCNKPHFGVPRRTDIASACIAVLMMGSSISAAGMVRCRIENYTLL